MKSKPLFLAITALAALLLPGCAAKRPPLPTANTVCLVLEGLKEPGAPFVKRKIASQLLEEGFRLVDTGCDITLTYTNFNSGEWEMINRTLFGTKSSNAWRAEGVVALFQGGKPVVEDERIDRRDYKTMQDLLIDISSDIVGVVTDHFRSASKSKP